MKGPWVTTPKLLHRSCCTEWKLANRTAPPAGGQSKENRERSGSGRTRRSGGEKVVTETCEPYGEPAGRSVREEGGERLGGGRVGDQAVGGGTEMCEPSGDRLKDAH